MRFNPEDADSESHDFFDGPDIPDTPREEKPKKVEFTPDDPRYWEEESEWEHLRAPKPRRRVWMWGGAALLCVLLAAGLWLRYFSPYVEGAVQYGYVDSIEHRGTIFKTYEGVLIPYKELIDTTRLYTRDFIFTASDARVATQLRRMQLEARPVIVRYKRYHATLPWRGSSKIIVTGVDSADPAKILPPEFTPADVSRRK